MEAIYQTFYFGNLGFVIVFALSKSLLGWKYKLQAQQGRLLYGVVESEYEDNRFNNGNFHI